MSQEERLSELFSMVDKDQDKSDRSSKQKSPDEGADTVPIPSVNLDSEALAHLQILCEQFDAHVSAYADDASVVHQQRMLEDLGRFRNTLVVLEKPATAFVVRELLVLLESHVEQPLVDNHDLSWVLSGAALQLREHVSLMQSDVSLDNALSMVALVNDCRACRDEMLFSDVLMLAAGIPLPAVLLASVSDDEWSEQRLIWVEFAQANNASLEQQIAHCWRATNAGSAAPLIRQLDAFVELTSGHIYLQSLTPLFQCASLLAQALEAGNVINGPALRSLYSQLEHNVRRCELVASPEDLLPGDLLRNFLYYVAQLDDDSDASLDLRRRFRLDRVRQVSHSTRYAGTPTIGVGYHLTNAIRSGVTHETEPLRAWLDAPDGEHAASSVIRLRVRLAQLEPVLAVMGAADALECLKTINAQLQMQGNSQQTSETARIELAQSLLRLDALLDQSARRSVLGSKPADAAQISGSDVYLDMATDACLREARNELQSVAEHLLPMLQRRVRGAEIGKQFAQQLGMINSALQILPLPEVRPLFSSIASLVQLLFPCLSADDADRDINTAGNVQIYVSAEAQGKLKDLLAALDDYLGCVLLPQPAASQILTDAEDTLEQLHDLLLQAEQNESPLHGPASQNDLLLEDVGSLTLNVDDDLLLDVSSDDELPGMDNTLQLVFQHECLGHLESLDESVSRALKPSTQDESYLPNEQMLRALHTLSGSAQTIGAIEVADIVQPLQRAALELHRQGRYFDAGQTRFISDLVMAIRGRLDAFSTGEPVAASVTETENRLSQFLAHVVPAMREELDSSSSALSIGSGLTSLDDVFQQEASDLLEQLRSAIGGAPFTAQSVTRSLAILHTLKGSARMAGKLSISDVAHELEAQVQSLDVVDEQLLAFKAGYRNLNNHLLRGADIDRTDESSVASSTTSGKKNTFSHQANVSNISTDRLLNIATELTVNQAQLTEQFSLLQAVREDIELATLRIAELLRSGELPETPALVELVADMQDSRNQLREKLSAAELRQHQAARVGANLQQSLVRANLARVDELSDRLTATIDDIAGICGVSARLEMSGGELMVDREMLRKLLSPLEHLARNAVVHGIESAEERIALSKPGAGVIGVTATMEGAELVLTFHDDGRGISRETLNAILRDRGDDIVSIDSDMQQVLFKSGFSSVTKADTVAGHGLGLSAVKASVEQMDGRVDLDLQNADGFRITLRVPQRLVVNQVVLVQIDERYYGLPVANVSSVQLGAQEGLADGHNETQTTPQIALRALLGDSSESHRPLSSKGSESTMPSVSAPLVNVAVGGQSLVIEVDSVVGYRELVIQPLGEQLASLCQFTAGSVLPNGQQVLILDLAALMERMKSSTLNASADETPRELRRPTVLIVDDSSTTRNKAQNMLLGRGVEVKVCKDGLAALDSLAREIPHLMILDLEMPRLDGWGVLRRVRKIYADVALPIIVVSSRGDTQARDMASKLGAVRYLIKPYSESELQEAIQFAGLRLPDLTIA